MRSAARPDLSPLQRAYRFVNRPYYIYRPSQLRARLSATAASGAEPRLLSTAWGTRLYCWADPVGSAVARTGVYDLAVSETLARLPGEGETVIDAGSHVGLMTNLLALAVGPSGRVVAYEPHPANFATLERNVELWRSEGVTVVSPRREAVSSQAGEVALSSDPATFAANKGTASLEPHDGADVVHVHAVRLDDEFASAVGVLKLDVEMHELAALQGAERLLEHGMVRDIVFEEHQRPPTPVMELLESKGYSVLGVRQGLSGPVVCTPAEAYASKLWDPPALLATRDPARARERLRRRGWVTLRSGLRRR